MQATDDPRLKIIEVVLTLGGILGIILTLQQNIIAQYGDVLTVLIIIFIVSTLAVYSGIILQLKPRRFELALILFSASFSGLLTLPLGIIFGKYLSQFLVQFLLTQNGGLLATVVFVVFLIIFLLITMLFYWKISQLLQFVLKEPPSRDTQKNNAVPNNSSTQPSHS